MARDQGSLSRRSFCWTLAGVLAAPNVAMTQVSTRVRRIGLLSLGESAEPEEIWSRSESLRKRGWVEGKNLQVERRYGRTEAAMHPLAEELVRAQVEIIVTASTPATLAAMHATSTIPIVFDGVGDPVLLGLVASLARPGGNVTGWSAATMEVTAKQLSLLKDLLPGLQRVGFVWLANPYYRAIRPQFEHVCQTLGLAPIIVEVGGMGEIGDAIAQLVRQRAQAMVLLSGSGGLEALGAATTRGLPTMTDEAAMVRAGALISYGDSAVDDDRLLADYIDRILRGAKPADLPVQQPTNFELAINLKTAKALGITVPQSLLVSADEVVQ